MDGADAQDAQEEEEEDGASSSGGAADEEGGGADVAQVEHQASDGFALEASYEKEESPGGADAEQEEGADADAPDSPTGQESPRAEDAAVSSANSPEVVARHRISRHTKKLTTKLNDESTLGAIANRLRRQLRTVCKSSQGVRRLLRRFDKDRSGTLTTEDIDSFLKALDDDGTGSLSVDELVDFLGFEEGEEEDADSASRDAAGNASEVRRPPPVPTVQYAVLEGYEDRLEGSQPRICSIQPSAYLYILSALGYQLPSPQASPLPDDTARRKKATSKGASGRRDGGEASQSLSEEQVRRLQSQLKFAVKSAGGGFEKLFRKMLSLEDFKKLVRMELRVTQDRASDLELEALVLALDKGSSGTLDMKELQAFLEVGASLSGLEDKVAAALPAAIVQPAIANATAASLPAGVEDQGYAFQQVADYATGGEFLATPYGAHSSISPVSGTFWGEPAAVAEIAADAWSPLAYVSSVADDLYSAMLQAQAAGYMAYPQNAYAGYQYGGSGQQPQQQHPGGFSPRSSPRRRQLPDDVVKRLRTQLTNAARSSGGDFERLLRKFDKDRSGTLTIDEFKRMIRMELRVTPENLSDKDLADFVAALDDDDTGSLSLEEITDFIERGAPTFFSGEEAPSLLLEDEAAPTTSLPFGGGHGQGSDPLSPTTSPAHGKPGRKKAEVEGSASKKGALTLRSTAKFMQMAQSGRAEPAGGAAGGRANDSSAEESKKTKLPALLGAAAKAKASEDGSGEPSRVGGPMRRQKSNGHEKMEQKLSSRRNSASSVAAAAVAGKFVDRMKSATDSTKGEGSGVEKAAGKESRRGSVTREDGKESAEKPAAEAADGDGGGAKGIVSPPQVGGSSGGKRTSLSKHQRRPGSNRRHSRLLFPPLPNENGGLLLTPSRRKGHLHASGSSWRAVGDDVGQATATNVSPAEATMPTIAAPPCLPPIGRAAGARRPSRQRASYRRSGTGSRAAAL
eukprot:TRINITY_DN16535_c0_g1_i3.p1 TRINITY_DN16535_c0_g1~~TRINITY_DN16535_c0_g1_i3.p1  ORF type:complete len:968 (+),score=281.25 TRINITY_DN16535_c0_g1_i3:140-3043(+)